MKRIILAFTIISLSFYGVKAQTWNEIAKTLPIPYSQTIPDQNFGNSISIDSNYAVVGAPNYNNSIGIAYVLHYDGNNWEIIAKLLASDGNDGDNFGCSVDINNNNIVIGAWGDDDQKGAVYIFSKPINTWVDTVETIKLIASDAEIDDYFGNSVSISDSNIVVGSPRNDDYGTNSGTVYVFTKTLSNWVETAKLTRTGANQYENFGTTVDIYDNNIVVGSVSNDTCYAYVYTKPINGWIDTTETAKLTVSDNSSASYYEFGKSVCISQNTIVIGAPYYDEWWEMGAVYVYTKPISGWTDTTETAKLLPSDLSEETMFGNSVSIYNNNIVIGTNSHSSGLYDNGAYIYTKPINGWTDTTETAKLAISNNSSFAISVCIFNNNIFVSAPEGESFDDYKGSIYIYKEPTNGWNDSINADRIYPNNYLDNINDYYGTSVSIDGDYAVVGASHDHTRTGAAYVLHFNGLNWVTVAKLTASDGEQGPYYTNSLGDYFGQSVDISEDNIVIGAYGNNSKGAAYVFTKPAQGWSDTTETAKLTASDGQNGDYFGFSVGISNDNIVVGAYNNNVNGNISGAAYVFTKPAQAWSDTTETAKLIPSDGADNDYFGYAVSIYENDIVIGAWGDDDNLYNGDIPSVYVYTKPTNAWVDTTETAKLQTTTLSAANHFGASVDIYENDIIVGAYCEDYDGNSTAGAAYVFTKPTNGWTDTTETARFIASDANAYQGDPYQNAGDLFGNSVSIYNNLIVIGAYDTNDTIKGKGIGTAYVFSKPTNAWTDTTETFILKASDGDGEHTTCSTCDNGDHFGCSVAISENDIIIGAYGNDDNGSMSGSAYLYRFCNDTYSTISLISCNSYTSPSGNIYTSSGTYIDTILNNNLCDSIIHINLTINYSDTNIIDTNICYNSSYIFADGYELNNIISNYEHTSILFGQSTNGCDSIIVENLIVYPYLTPPVITENSGILYSNYTDNNQWYYNGNIISGETNQTYEPSFSGYFKVSVDNGNSCLSFSDEYYFLYTNISHNNTEDIKLYPNPFSKILNIEFKEDFSIFLYDLTGRKILYKNMKNTKKINLSFLNKGIYIIKIYTNNGLEYKYLITKE